jgi:hypothetical protein
MRIEDVMVVYKLYAYLSRLLASLTSMYFHIANR